MSRFFASGGQSTEVSACCTYVNKQANFIGSYTYFANKLVLLWLSLIEIHLETKLVFQ